MAGLVFMDDVNNALGRWRHVGAGAATRPRRLALGGLLLRRQSSGHRREQSDCALWRRDFFIKVEQQPARLCSDAPPQSATSDH
jgi:hypothetical protein